MKVRRVQGDIARGDDQDPEDQGARNGPLGLAGFFRRISHHVPSTEGEKAGNDGERELRECEWTARSSLLETRAESGIRESIAGAERERNEDDRHNRADLENRQRRLDQ